MPEVKIVFATVSPRMSASVASAISVSRMKGDQHGRLGCLKSRVIRPTSGHSVPAVVLPEISSGWR